MKTKTSIAVWGTAALMGLVLLAGCGNKESTEPAATPTASAPAAAPATPIDPATAATIIGVVKFEGTAPKAAMIDMSQDPACKGMNMAENVPSIRVAANIIPTFSASLPAKPSKSSTAIPPLTIFTRLRKTTASGTSHSLPQPPRSRKPSPAKKSCCP